MNSDWPIVRLGEYCSKVGSGSTPRGGANVYLDKGDVCLIRSQNIYNDGFKPNGLVYITEEAADKLKNVIIEKNDVLINITGDSVARVCLAKEEYLPARVNQHVAIIRPEPKHFDARYLRYLLTSSAMQALLLTISAVGATRNALTKNMIELLEVSKPPLHVQVAIAEHLEKLDCKIELNRQTNQTLEQIAQAIFKSWFVDFDPVRAKIAAKEVEEDIERAAMTAISGKSEAELNQLQLKHPNQYQQLQTSAALFPDNLIDSELGEIPEGWGLTKLSTLIQFNPKRALKKGVLAPYLDMKNVPTEGHLANEVILREMASGTKFINGDTLLARITPCLENGKTAYVDFLEEDQVGWGSTEYIVMRPRSGRPHSLGYMLARYESFRIRAIQTMTGTSGRQRANADALSDLAWLDYPIALLNVFDSIAGGYLAKAKTNGDENKVLSQLRDYLLPKLLAGGIPISHDDGNRS